jgi:hypothetical protein
MDMELATNVELIGELMQRQTFAGIIISSTDEHRNSEQTHNEFQVYTAACPEDTVAILKKIISEMEAVQ